MVTGCKTVSFLMILRMQGFVGGHIVFPKSRFWENSSSPLSHKCLEYTDIMVVFRTFLHPHFSGFGDSPKLEVVFGDFPKFDFIFVKENTTKIWRSL